MPLTVGDILAATDDAACESLTRAEVLALLGFKHLYRTADATAINNSTAMVADDTLLFAIAANEAWHVEFGIFWNSATANLKLDFTGPAAPTDVKYGLGPGNTESSFSPGAATAFGSKVGTYNVAGPDMFLGGYALIQNGANAGTVTLRYAQNAGVSENTTIQKGSYLIARRISA